MGGEIIDWTSTADEAYEIIRLAIHNCPKLFFMDNESPISLQSDASDYGIGAYLFQTTNGVETPIAFVSKSLDRSQIKWTTAQKEGYAIYYSLKKWEYLLRDKHFLLQTDHDNLTMLKNETSDKKVLRWMTELQTFDYRLEHIPGKLNEVADAFSRLVFEERLNDDTDMFLCPIQDIVIPKLEWRKIKDAHKLNHPPTEEIDYFKDVLPHYHSSIGGHHGVEKTLIKLRQHGHEWPDMKVHVKKYIRLCPCCQKMAQRKMCVKTHPYTTSTYYPMERLAIDYIERLLPDSNGNTMIVVIIDCFTRFIELFPTKDTGAEGAATALLNHFGRYGTHLQILSDRGSQFTSDLIQHFTRLVGTDHRMTMAYSKEENSIIERANKEVLRHT